MNIDCNLKFNILVQFVVLSIKYITWDLPENSIAVMPAKCSIEKILRKQKLVLKNEGKYIFGAMHRNWRTELKMRGI